MDFKQYINNDYEPFLIDLKVSDVKKAFSDLPFTHFPIVDDGKLIGMLSPSDLIHFPKNELNLNQIAHFFQHYKVQSDTNCIDLLALFAKNNTDILPVIDDQNYYLGYFELEDIIAIFHKTPFLMSDAKTLMIQKDTKNFSFSEITQIVETNGIKILGMYVSELKENTTQITLRLETNPESYWENELIQSFRRYNYEILTQHENDLLMDQLKERSLYLHKFYDL